MTAAVHVFGIRHHGPGSAISLMAALDELRPTCVLIEGPPEADSMIPLASAPGMRPPLALLTYPSGAPDRARFFPFAEFSPEWRAMLWANQNGAAVRFIDLPTPTAPEPEPSEDEGEAGQPESAAGRAFDPLGQLAAGAGHSDGEAWWNALIEQAPSAPAVFDAIHDAMATLRQEVDELEPNEAQREAFMRQQIRAAQREIEAGAVAVVCGAWHAPALTAKIKIADDRATLRGFKKESKVEACWVPWTDPRLTSMSGYGAGVSSPGWYSHLWRAFELGESSADFSAIARWQTQVAHRLRDEGHAAATSSVIDATRLAVSLASIRGHAVPGLREMRDATLAAICHGERALLTVIEDALVVGRRVGVVDDSAPQPPLQQDLQRLQRRLRLKPEAEAREVAVDLRSQAGMAKSELFWRLGLIDVPWARLLRATSGRGTFREVWTLVWEPELSVKLAEAAVYGPTVAEAAHESARQAAQTTRDPAALAELVRTCLLANLPTTAEAAIAALRERAVDMGTNALALMATVPPLCEVLRYGTARELPLEPLRELVDHLIVEISATLRFACSGLDEEQATAAHEHICELDAAVALLDQAHQLEQWRRGVRHLAAEDHSIAPRLRGGATRILHDRGWTEVEDETEKALSRALSPAAEPSDAGAWLEGFLSSSGDVLLHDERLLQGVDAWLVALSADAFTELLPALRRALSAFDATMRRRMLASVGRQQTPRRDAEAAGAINDESFAAALPLLGLILDLPLESRS